ncbi:MAG: hypothetical protein V7782_07075 [Psychromonas sp.]
MDSSGVAIAANSGTDGNWDITVPAPVSDAITYKPPNYAANDSDSQWISSNENGGIFYELFV